MSTEVLVGQTLWRRTEAETQAWSTTFAGAAMALAALLGSSTAGPAPRSPQLANFSAVRDWTESTAAGSCTYAGTTVGLLADAGATRTTAEQVLFAHEVSGLTWEQMARLFGVSRRSLHAWAGGGRLSSANAERVAQFVGLLETRRHHSPDQNRSWLISSAPTRPSAFDSIRASWRRGPIIEDVLDLREQMGIR